ncbi:unnamed protein product [Cylicocyclus nassatus]|uniref:Uncharacterized protein n=1 Tax=Cylicocyclus nassatus TaxID=53992 RepID=A0AA36MA07_CYLNA|nr:unnamed protein product [Cylicocyclus nassatus]
MVQLSISKICWCVLCFHIPFTVAKGFSKQKPDYDWRAQDTPLEDSLCKEPTFSANLPENMRKEIHSIWKAQNSNEDCFEKISKTRKILAQLSPSKRRKLLNGARQCKPPDIVKTLPDPLRARILDIWKQRDPSGNCWEQQRKTRLLLLNLPLSIRRRLHPAAMECALPHFIDRLEWDLQVKLRNLWADYKKGEPCTNVCCT